MKSFFLKFLFIFFIIKSSTLSIESNIFNSKKTLFKGGIKEYSSINNKLVQFSDINPNPTKKYLIIGAISNFNWDKVGIFFKSYQMVNFQNCDCIMFVSKMSESTIKKIESCGVKVLPVPEKYQSLSISNAKWKIFEEFLTENSDKYDLVFTADIKNTIFQYDFFKLYDPTKPFLGVAIEDGTLTEEYNKNWLINAYGEDLYQTIKDEKIIIAGSILGTPDKFVQLCKVMWENLTTEESKKRNTIEQAVLNYLIYHDKMFNDFLTKSNNNDGFIMAIGSTKRKDIILDKDHNILNGKGHIGAVIHQYDRFSDLSYMAIYKYCPELNKKPLFIFLCIVLFICSIISFVYCYNRRKKIMQNDIGRMEIVKIPKEELNSQLSYKDEEETDDQALNHN